MCQSHLRPCLSKSHRPTILFWLSGPGLLCSEGKTLGLSALEIRPGQSIPKASQDHTGRASFAEARSSRRERTGKNTEHITNHREAESYNNIKRKRKKNGRNPDGMSPSLLTAVPSDYIGFCSLRLGRRRRRLTIRSSEMLPIFLLR